MTQDRKEERVVVAVPIRYIKQFLPSPSICNISAGIVTHFHYVLFLKPEYSPPSSQGTWSHVLSSGAKG